MKRYICVAATLFLSTSLLAAGELVINDSPLTLVLSDQNQAHVSSCADFISLRKAGETVKELPELSDPDFRTAQDAVCSCWLHAYTTEHDMSPVNANKPALADILQHFPASAAYLVSNKEQQDVKMHYAGKSIADYTPDLKAKDDRLESAARSTGYVLDDYYTFADKKGNQLNIVALTGYATGGTAADKAFYRVDDMHDRIWKVTRLDENSHL